MLVWNEMNSMKNYLLLRSAFVHLPLIAGPRPDQVLNIPEFRHRSSVFRESLSDPS